MEQTQEIGERHIDLLSALAVEALPGCALAAHGLDHERDHYWLSLTNDATGQTRRLVFTRMFLSDASRLPAVVADANAPVRAQIVACIREQAARPEIFVTVAGLLTEEERLERDEIEAEWRKKHEAAQAAKRAEEERRAHERQRQRQQEEARRQAQRERERRERARRDRSSSSRARAAGGAAGVAGAAEPEATRAAAVRSRNSRRVSAAAPRPPQPANAPPPEASRVERGGGRRRRRRGRGRGPGGPKPGGGGQEPSPL